MGRPYVLTKKRAKAIPSAMKNCAECGKPFRATGWRVAPGPMEHKLCSMACRTLYQRLSPTTADRLFWPQVQKGDGCWLWQGRKDKAGYGRYGRKGDYVYPHRIVWLFTKGEIPADMEVAHTCDVRSCCNPAHLFLATHEENMADCKAKGRQVKGTRVHFSKITEEQARYVKANYRKTSPRSGNAREVAAALGISTQIIHAIGRGRSWKHVK